jgi:cobalamin-dependent methionine synthase I
MVIVGERINGSTQRVREAVLARDAELIAQEARRQAEAGADYIDVNAGTDPQREPEDMAWLVETVQAAVEKPVCIDSANIAALKSGLEACRGQAVVNSFSAEEGRLEQVLALVKRHSSRAIGLTLDGSRLPKSAEERIAIAARLVEAAESAGLARGDLFIDPLARSVATENDQGAAFLEAVAGIREKLAEVHVICGLSNISFQMPARRLLNRTFLAMAMARGLDAAILDPLDRSLMAAVCAGEALLGRDEMCMNYIRAYRGGRLEPQE